MYSPDNRVLLSSSISGPELGPQLGPELGQGLGRELVAPQSDLLIPQPPVLIEEEDDEDKVYAPKPKIAPVVDHVVHHHHHPNQVVKLVRPIPLKLVRPIPVNAAASFYHQSRAQGLSSLEVQQALWVSAEWHRKWTHQDEGGHGFRQSAAYDDLNIHLYDNNNNNNKANNYNSFFADYETFRLNEGAKNPSPEEQDNINGTINNNSSNNSYCGRRKTVSILEPRKRVRVQDQREQQQHKLKTNQAAAVITATATTINSCVLVRPIPLRIPRPCLPSTTTSSAVVVIPTDYQIMDKHDKRNGLRRQHSDTNTLYPTKSQTATTTTTTSRSSSTSLKTPSPQLSPLTVSSQTSSVSDLFLDEQEQQDDDYDDSFNHHHQPKRIHLIEPDTNDGDDNNKVEVSEQDRIEEEENEAEEYQRRNLRSFDMKAINVDSGHSKLLLRCRLPKENYHNQNLNYPTPRDSSLLTVARDALFLALASQGGHTTGNVQFQTCLERLLALQSTHQQEQQEILQGKEEGMWVSLTAPMFFGSLGNNDAGDPLYTLGRMTFDMFSPTSLICSLQGNFNSVQLVTDAQRTAFVQDATTTKTTTASENQKQHSNNPSRTVVPKSLREEVQANTSALRTYDIMAAFTIEPPLPDYPDAPNADVQRPIKGVMTTYGYTLPDPTTPHRYSLWITGGRIEPNPGSDQDLQAWKRQFQLHPAQHSLSEKAKLLAVKWLMGAHLHPMVEENGVMEYTLTRPIGGHGVAYLDTLYCDATLRILKGHRGTVFVFARMPDNKTS